MAAREIEMEGNPKELIKYLIQALVAHPEKVEISEIKATALSVIEVKVVKEDLGIVLEGKEG